MMWGGIAANRRTHLVTINGSLNAERYRNEILTPHVLPFIAANGATFQQDNARLPVARASMNCLRQNNVDGLPWATSSQHLSPIEQRWEQLDR